MTRRDYIALAEYLRDLKPTTGGYQLQRWREFVAYITIRCKQDNKRFDTERFHNACTYGAAYDDAPLKEIVKRYHSESDGD